MPDPAAASPALPAPSDTVALRVRAAGDPLAVVRSVAAALATRVSGDADLAGRARDLAHALAIELVLLALPGAELLCFFRTHRGCLHVGMAVDVGDVDANDVRSDVVGAAAAVPVRMTLEQGADAQRLEVRAELFLGEAGADRPAAASGNG